MVATLEKLQEGIFTVSKEFGDGSVSWFRCTASPTILYKMNLDTERVYNVDTAKPIPMQEILDGKLNIVEDKDVEGFNPLDKYLNRGVAGECFNIG